MLQTLGKLELRGGSCSRPKSLLLLSYLVMEGPQERRVLADLFFGQTRNRLGSLRTTLQRLRREAPGAVVDDAGRLRSALPCDARSLLGLLDSGDLVGATRAYTGAFLAGIYRPDWNAHLEQWVDNRREQIARRVRGALLDLAEGAAAQGDFAEAAQLAERACWLLGAPLPSPEEAERLLLLLTAGQSARLGQFKRPVPTGPDWTVAEAQRALVTRLHERPQASWAAWPTSAAGPETGTLVLGINGFLNHPLVPQALSRYAAQYPQARLSFRELFSSAQIEALTQGTLDVAFVTLPIENDQIAWELIWREAYIALLPARHPLARRREVPLSALADEPLIMHPRRVHPPLFEHVLGLLRNNGIVPPRLLEGAMPQTRNQFVAGGFGYTLALPSWPAELPGLVRRPIRYALHQQPMVMDGAVAWHRSRLSAPAAAFVEIVLALRTARPSSP
ncbi:LysR family substrate-binding domain-containing protein [Deinococcus alpinitundrae]|uniref:LysR family substrate-binding domain-containing protein n=1 Tax=Deinococcus alpinitundrae TaxID=468913 RepID=UPI00137A4FDC|nr:LysR family substrate-binding domain-containing protein [Deinococcus alpinitundrae]